MTGNDPNPKWEITNVRVETGNRPRAAPIPAEDWILAMEYGGISIQELLQDPREFYHQRLDSGIMVGFSFEFFTCPPEHQPEHQPEGQAPLPFVVQGRCHPALETGRGDFHTLTDQTLAKAVIRFGLPDPERREELALELVPSGPEHPGVWLEPVEPPSLSIAARDRALRWMLDGETGLSSIAILRAALPADTPGPVIDPMAREHPVDPFDLRRCVLMLEQVPEARCGITALAGQTREWAQLAGCWDELETALRSEWAPSLEDWPSARDGAAAPITRRMIEEAIGPRPVE